MRILAVWVALALTTSLTLTQSNAVIVRGNVVGVDGAFVQATIVLISEDPERIVQTITSDANGRFEFRNVAPGPYRVQAQRTSNLVLLVRESTSNVAVARVLAGSSPVSEVTLVMIPTGSVSGRITDVNGGPASGATVTAVRMAYQAGLRTLVQSTTALADENGSYRLFGLSPGELYIYAEGRPGVTRADTGTYSPGSSEFETAVPVTLQAGANLSSMDLQLRSSATVPVRIRVVDDKGNPRQTTLTLESLDRLTPRAGSPVAVVLITSVSSPAAPQNEQIRNVRPGSYELVARSTPPNITEQGRISLRVGNGAPDAVTVVLRPGVAVNARVVSGGGAVINPSTLRYQLEQRDRIGFRISPARESNFTGTFKFEAVPEGKAVPRILGLPSNYYIADVRQDGRSVFNDGLITIARQPVSLEWEVRSDGGRVEGTVQGVRSPNIVDTRVVLVPDAPRRANPLLYQATNPDASGKFALEGVAPGNYRIFAWESILDGAWENAEYLAAFERFGRSVSVSSGIPANASVDWIPRTVSPPAVSMRVASPASIVDSTTRSIEGTVTNALNGKPIGGVRVRLSQQPQNSIETTTDPDGKFGLPQVPEGRFMITVQRDGFLGPLVNGNYSDAISQNVTIDARTPKVSLAFSLNPGGSLSGRILDPNGKPAVSAEVNVANLLIPSRNKIARTDDRGEFHVTGLVPSPYTVFVREPRAVTSTQQKEGIAAARTFFPGAIDSSRATAVAVSLGADIRNVDFQIQLAPIFRISGKVAIDPAGLQLPAQASLVPNVRAISTEDTTAFVPVFTGPVDRATGEFEIRGVPTGKYAVIATIQASGTNAAAVAMVEVSSQDVRGLQLLVRKGMDLHVEIVDGVKSASTSRQLMLTAKTRQTPFDSRIIAPANSTDFVFTNIFPGTYDLNLNMLGNECLRDMRQGGRSILESGPTIGEGSADPIRIVLETTRQTLPRAPGVGGMPRCPAR